MVRVSLLSYSYHDLPPNFNLDPRFRVQDSNMAAPTRNHRSHGKWTNLRTSADVCLAFTRLVPGEPCGAYRYFSNTLYEDQSLRGTFGSYRAPTIQAQIAAEYNAGYRGYFAESDFNFGKRGLNYYLYSKMLWDPTQTPQDLDAIENRWLTRAFGAEAAPVMRQYYDFVSPEAKQLHLSHVYNDAVHLIAQADALIPSGNVAAKQRLDDLKQYWYYYYLADTNAKTSSGPPSLLQEFVWRGQMSYMTSEFMVESVWFGNLDAFVDGTPTYAGSSRTSPLPARYSPQRTAEWWPLVLEHWNRPDIQSFGDVVLSDGHTTGAQVDVNDLVQVQEFKASNIIGLTFGVNARNFGTVSALTVARPTDTNTGWDFYWGAKPPYPYDVPYSVSKWNADPDPAKRDWISLVDFPTTETAVSGCSNGDQRYDVVPFRQNIDDTGPGTYRITLLSSVIADLSRNGGGSGDVNVILESPDAEIAPTANCRTNFTTNVPAVHALTFTDPLIGIGGSNGWVYIPQPGPPDAGPAVRHLDFENLAESSGYNITATLYTGLPSPQAGGAHLQVAQLNGSAWSVVVSGPGYHSIDLTGHPEVTFARLSCSVTNGGACIAMPFFDSVPNLWAQSTERLLVPRQIACADHLTPMTGQGTCP
jgi:hypothetical protein